MSDITNIWLIAGTSDSDNAQSDDTMELEFNLSGGTDVTLETSSTSGKWGSIGSPGDAVIWQWASPYYDQGSEISFSVSDIQTIDLEATGDDAWMVANTFVVVEDSDSTYTMMSANGDLNQCLSQQSSDCGGDATDEITLYSAS